ncbi:type VII secretion-associated serine protease mycosin [Streptomyces sp. cg35]|uniref:type VII secretion-associated serine protease mycosin n=1 Tax=Streptomyces sp. cg35 TaxID=3421650 RepID=UPI003D16F65B
MPTIGHRRKRAGAVASALFGLLLVGTATTPAHAESTRSQQWFLDVMHAESMWKTSTGTGVKVAVIDTGVDTGNADLKGRVLDGKDLASSKRAGDEHTDYDGHGTGMAGLIAGTGAFGGGQGAFGLAPGAQILPVRMPDASEITSFAMADRMSQAIRYSVDAGAKVINISMGGGADSRKLKDAVGYAIEKGALIFAAVGNSGASSNTVEYPAATPGVVGVGAVGKNLTKTGESTAGSQVDLSAPGDEMVHACGGKTGLCKTSGSSDATALASASAALIWSKHPNWTNNQVLRVMLNTIGGPTDGAKRNDGIGYGIVRPRIALKTPGAPGPADKFPMADYPAAATSPSSGASKGTGAQTSDGDQAADSSAKSDDSNAGLWIGVGVAVVVVIGAAVAFGLTRRRRRDAQQLPPPAAPMQPYPGGPSGTPYGTQQPYGNQQFTGQQPYGSPTPGSNPDHNPYHGS